MRFTTYTKYRKSWLDALNLEGLMEMLSDFLLDGGFAGGPHFHPYWGWSGLEDTSSVDALKQALLQALLESGQLTPEMVEELRGDGPGDPDVQREIADLLDQLVQKMIEEGYITLTGEPSGSAGPTGDATGAGHVDDAREAARQVNFNLSSRGLDFLGYRALRNLLGSMGKSSIGSHETREYATGVESDAGSKPYEFGDTLNLDISETLKNAIAREGLPEPGSHSLALDYKDLMVHQTDYRSSCATVLMLDVSHSMILYGEDRFSPAKKVALALSHLIRTEFPGDSLRVVTFGDRAKEIPLGELPRAQVGPFHTNTAEGLELARRILTTQKKGHAPDHHDHRRQADRDHPQAGPRVQEFGRARPEHPAGDLSRGCRVPALGDPDQHVHARGRPLSGSLRARGGEDRPRQGVLHLHDDAGPAHRDGLPAEAAGGVGGEWRGGGRGVGSRVDGSHVSRESQPGERLDWMRGIFPPQIMSQSPSRS